MPKHRGIFYVTQGEQGPGVWFFHGAGGYHGVWLSYLRGLRHQARGLALDLPGHGRSDAFPITTLADYAEVVLSFWKDLAVTETKRVPPEILVGHSLGGAIALLFGLRLQQEGRPPRAIVLVGSAFRFRVQSTTAPENQESLCRALFYRPSWRRRCIESRELPLFTDPVTLSRDLQLVQNFDFRPLAPQLRTQIVWIHGVHDQILPFSYVQDSARWAPSHKIYTIPQSGHMPHLEARDRVLSILKEVID